MARYYKMINRPIYIHTIPKAGTYFLATLLESLGYFNTGWHIIGVDMYLDTKSFDPDTNRERPTQTEKKQFFIKTFRQIEPSQFAFGHFPPNKLPNGLANKFAFLSSYRHPREVLESEFIDFRYRRSDVPFISLNKIESFSEAFEVYLERHGPILRNLFIEFFSLQDRYTNPLYRRAFPDNNLCIDFKDLISGENSLPTLKRILKFFDCKIDNPFLFLEQVKAKDNKTKSVGLKLPFEKSELWTEKTRYLYQEIGLEDVEKALLELKKKREYLDSNGMSE